MPIIRLADQNPGNTGNLIISICSYPGNILSFLLLSWKYWKLKSPLFPESWKSWKYYFCQCLCFLQKRRAPKFHAEPTDQWAEISHMRPIRGQKIKQCFTWFSNYFRIILILLGIWYFVYAQYWNDITRHDNFFSPVHVQAHALPHSSVFSK